MSVIDVDVKNVTKYFGDILAVDNISLAIEKGEFFSLLGPSGCGKTTVLRMISGFEKPSKGEVYIGGESMTDRPPFKRPTNLVFQNLSLFPHMNVFKNIGFGLEMKGFSKDRIKKEANDMLDLIELSGFGDRKINQLSGGQQQRVAIARALINHPTVLLLDEPLGALDLKLRNQMQVELKRIQREVGTTFIYVTHDQGEALTMSNRIAVMNNGIVEQIGESNDIYENPETIFVANFIGDTNLIEGMVSSLEESRSVVTYKDLPIYASLRENLNMGDKVFISIRPEKIMISEDLSGIENIYSGIVEEAVYHGELTIYTVFIQNRLHLTIKVQNDEIKKSYPQGARVQVGWGIDRGVLITGDDD